MPDHGGPVEVTLVIAARPGTIFRYFTDPARFARWMGEASVSTPSPAAACGSATRPGRPPAAGWWPSTGPADRLHLGYEGDRQAVPAGSSTVEITLEPVADGTEVRLRHPGLPAGEPPLAHLAGWRHAWPPWPTPARPTSWPSTSAWSSG